MCKFSGFGNALLLACVVALSPCTVGAQDADTREVQNHVLTQSGLSKYAKASRALAELRGASCADEDGADDSENSDDDSESASLADMVAKLDAMPGAGEAIESAGMTTREYVVFSLSLLHNGLAAWAVSQPGGKLPAGASQANLDFFNQHKPELAELEGLSKGSDCDPS